MKVGGVKVSYLVAAVLAALVGWGAYAVVHGQRASETADRRREYTTKLFVQQMKDRVAAIGSKRLGAAAYAKASAEHATAASEAREAEAAYMDACKRCASAAECERDRLVIESGRATDNYNPCD